MSNPSLEKAIALKSQGNQFFKLNDYEKAVQCYSASIQTQPSVQAYCNRSIVHSLMQRHSEALLDCESALKIDKNHVKSLIRKGKCLIQLFRIDQGIKVMQDAMKLENGQQAKELIQSALKIKQNLENFKQFRSKKEFRQAQLCLSQIYPHMAWNIDIAISLIQCKAKLNKSQALLLLKNIQRFINQTSSLYWYLRAIIQLAHGSKLRAKRYIKQSVRYLSTKPLGEIEKLVLFQFTKQMLNQLLGNIDAIEPLISQAQNLVKGGKFKQAIRKLIKILDSDAISTQQRIHTLQLRARCYKQTKEKPKYLNDLNTLLRLHPEHTKGIQTRLQFYQSEQNYPLALKDAEKLHKITGKHAQIVEKIAGLIKSPKRDKLDYYQVLGINRGATTAGIKKAFKELAVIYHPDKNRGLNQQEQQFAKNKFKEIKKAQSCLIDPEKRQFYNRHRCDPQQFDQEGPLTRNGFDFFKFFQTTQFYTDSSQSRNPFHGSSSSYSQPNFDQFFPGGFPFSSSSNFTFPF